MKIRKATQKWLFLAVALVAVLFLLKSAKEGFEGGAAAGSPTFHVLIATKGRPELKNLLDSMRGQMRQGDAVTIVFDGKEGKATAGFTDDWVADFGCRVNVLEEEVPLKYYGHRIRNKYIPLLEPRTDFVMNADDDDTYEKNAFDTLRAKCKNKIDTLYIFKMRKTSDPTFLVPHTPGKIEIANIGGPLGVTPYEIAPKSKFGDTYIGDFEYYNGIKDHVRDIVFLDDVLYNYTK
jgi:hypothetical protein